MVNVSNNLLIFAVLPRGRRLRRGATAERLAVDKGRLLIACKFDQKQAQSMMTPLAFFNGQIHGFSGLFRGFFSVCFKGISRRFQPELKNLSTQQESFSTLINRKSSIYQYANSVVFTIFAPSNLKLIKAMIQLEVQVFLNEGTLQANKRIFDRIVDVADSKVIEFHAILRALSFLFGKKCIINFLLKTY